MSVNPFERRLKSKAGALDVIGVAATGLNAIANMTGALTKKAPEKPEMPEPEAPTPEPIVDEDTDPFKKFLRRRHGG